MKKKDEKDRPHEDEDMEKEEGKIVALALGTG